MEINKYYRDAKTAKLLINKINQSKAEVSFMEVCGTHTVQIFKTGIKSAINKNIRLISGPGCPVCVTSGEDIDKAISIAGCRDVIFSCFGDMIKVPGTHANLDSARGESGAKVKVMYSPIEALELAKEFPQKKVVMFGVGFETTIPAFASVLIRAKEQNIKNLYIFPVFKLIPPAIRALLQSKDINIDGFILPGHVSTIIGKGQYDFIADEFKKPAVITGFEAVDILEGILFLLEMLGKNQAGIKIEYSRSVSPQGNRLALEIIYKVFETKDAQWRGLGKIKQSGLKLKKEFREFDVDSVLEIKPKPVKENPGCICAKVIKGIKVPLDCKLYAKKCTPKHPVGPCMVSYEGTCAAHYNYGER